MIGLINNKYRKRIITLEDPVEYALQNKLSMIEQREVGFDCPDFASGLKHVLRQDPDIIMVGEMRDLETTSSTITAAETGHLVFSTLHTINASQTVERVIDIYPAKSAGPDSHDAGKYAAGSSFTDAFQTNRQAGNGALRRDIAVYGSSAKLYQGKQDLRNTEYYRDKPQTRHAESR